MLSSMSLVIAVYNQLPYTRRCLESIARCTDVPYEVVVVDNGSTDGTDEYLRSIGAQVITNPRNLGCAPAWNQGVRASKGQVLGILNNDLVMTPNWSSKLLSFMERSRHSIVSPSAREGPLDYDLDGYAEDFERYCAGATRYGEVYSACLLIKREVFDSVGLFDEGFGYGGCEDVDFLWRAERAGFTIGMTGAVLIHHFSMVTQDAIKAKVTRSYPDQNLAHFKRKWNRTVRGDWPERRWTDFKARIRKRYELLRYGHTLVEKPTRSSENSVKML
jgi:N-acetylglucosaminyl-diphospho-decaprenol L-rhamnosyltransferase